MVIPLQNRLNTYVEELNLTFIKHPNLAMEMPWCKRNLNNGFSTWISRTIFPKQIELSELQNDEKVTINKFVINIFCRVIVCYTLLVFLQSFIIMIVSQS